MTAVPRKTMPVTNTGNFCPLKRRLGLMGRGIFMRFRMVSVDAVSCSPESGRSVFLWPNLWRRVSFPRSWSTCHGDAKNASSHQGLSLTASDQCGVDSIVRCQIQ